MASTAKMTRLNLAALAEGTMPGLNRTCGTLLAEAAAVCVENREHLAWEPRALTSLARLEGRFQLKGVLTFAGYTARGFAGTLSLTPHGVSLSPMTFGMFDGKFDGGLSIDLRPSVPQAQLRGSVARLDVADVVKNTGTTGGITGRLVGARDGFKYYEAGLDLGLTVDAEDSFRLFQGRILEEYEKMIPEFGLTVIDATLPVEAQQAEVRRIVKGHLENAKELRVQP